MNLSVEQIEDLKKECLAILNYLPSPKIRYNRQKPDYFIRKGLVYSNVQSGKTASMAGVISQYVSLGCKAVFVLSGINNNLREQTQKRLVRDLGISNTHNKLNWSLITNPSDLLDKNCLDFGATTSGKRVAIGVFKKNSVVLTRLLKNFLAFSNEQILEDKTVLIIDDECDQASMNTKKISQEERTAINRKILQLIHKFPRVSYIGYTATPFANILNEAPGPKSLYPETFIFALDERPDYFGAKKIFGYGQFANYDDIDPLNATNILPSSIKTKDVIKKDLETPIRYFVLSTACKYYRAKILKKQSLHSHSTMLVHSSFIIDDHRKQAKAVECVLQGIKEEYSNNYVESYRKMESVWNSQFVSRQHENLDKIKELFPNTDIEQYVIPSFSQLMELAGEVLQKTQVRIDNSEAEDTERVKYDDSNPLPIIAVGGNTLSRGLTLEGLIVSVFTREVRTYDTLLQMGRWFGYKIGYEDLPRIWMSASVLEKFQYLAGIEADLRESIKNYSLAQDPTKISIAVRTTPMMNIVRKMAMQSATVNSLNYSGQRLQTIYFREDDDWLQKNIASAQQLVKVGKSPKFVRQNIVLKQIDFNSICNFLDTYQFHESSIGLDSKLLQQYIQKATKHGLLRSWNVVIKSVAQGKPCKLFGDFPINYLQRGKLKEEEFSDRINLKAITSREDILADIENVSPDMLKGSPDAQFKYRTKHFGSEKNVPGLILLYPIDKNSKPQKRKDAKQQRYPLNLSTDIIGVALVFPLFSVQNDTGLLDSVSIKVDTSYKKEAYWQDEDYDE